MSYLIPDVDLTEDAYPFTDEPERPDYDDDDDYEDFYGYCDSDCDICYPEDDDRDDDEEWRDLDDQEGDE